MNVTTGVRIWGDFEREVAPPSWFEFTTNQEGYKMYMVEEERRDFYKLYVLLYNESFGCAYFVDYEAIGN